MDRIQILKQTELFQSLTPTELTDLARACQVKNLNKGEVLFSAGEAVQGLYVIALGVLRAFRENMEGREQVIHIEKAVTTIAEVAVFDDQPYPSTVVAEEKSIVLLIAQDDVKRLCQTHPSIALAALKLLASRLRKTAALVESIALKAVDQRLALFLIQEMKHQQSKKIVLPVTSKLATQLGTVREVLSRALSKLEKQGLIRLKKNHEVEILQAIELSEISKA
jgi:CRP/FNR family transcriptional regulator